MRSCFGDRDRPRVVCFEDLDNVERVDACNSTRPRDVFRIDTGDGAMSAKRETARSPGVAGGDCKRAADGLMIGDAAGH